MAEALVRDAAAPPHRAHGYPAEAYVEARRDPVAAAALAAACEVVVREATDPRALLLCAQLGGADHLPFYDAVQRRLRGEPPLPRAPGASTPSLAAELANTLASPAVVANLPLFRQAVRAVAGAGLIDSLLLLLDRHDPDGELSAVLASAARGERGPVEPSSLELAVWSVAKRQLDTLMALAISLSALEPSLRELLADRVRRANPAWWSANGATFLNMVSAGAPG